MGWPQPKRWSAPVNWSGCGRAAAMRWRASCSRGRCRRAIWRTVTSWAEGGLRNARRKSAQRRILDQVQNAREEMVVGFGAADVNDRRVRQILDEEIENVSAGVVIQGIEHFVDEHPRRRVQRHAGECQGLLFVLAQFVIPAPRYIQ